MINKGTERCLLWNEKKHICAIGTFEQAQKQANLPCLSTARTCVQYPTSHLKTKKLATVNFFLTFSALLEFDSLPIYK